MSDRIQQATYQAGRDSHPNFGPKTNIDPSISEKVSHQYIANTSKTEEWWNGQTWQYATEVVMPEKEGEKTGASPVHCRIQTAKTHPFSADLALATAAQKLATQLGVTGSIQNGHYLPRLAHDSEIITHDTPHSEYVFPPGAFIARSFVDPLDYNAGKFDPQIIAEAMPRLSADVILALGKLSRADPSELTDFSNFPIPRLDETHIQATEKWLTLYRAHTKTHDVVVEAAWRALKRTAPAPPQHLSLVHGFGPMGGVGVDGDLGFIGLFNWQCVHIGNPLEDLAWALSPSVRIGGPANSADHVTTAEAIGLWQTESLLGVDLDSLNWWQILSSLKAITIAQWQRSVMASTDLEFSPRHAISTLRTLACERYTLACRVREMSLPSS